MKANFLKALIPVAMLLITVTSQAGVYGDDLTRCLLSSTTAKDKVNIFRKVYAGLSLHPAVADISSITDMQRQEISKTSTQIFQRLLKEDCRKEILDVIKYEEGAIRLSFSMLSDEVMKDIMADPSVSQWFMTYLLEKKLKDIDGDKK